MPPEFVAESIYCPNMYSNLLPIPSEPLLADFIKDLKKDHRHFINPKIPILYKPRWYLEDIKEFANQYRVCKCTSQMLRYILKMVRIGIKNHGLQEPFKFSKPDLYSNIIMQNRKRIASVIFCIKQIKIHNKLLLWNSYVQQYGKDPHEHFAEAFKALREHQASYNNAIQQIIVEIAQRQNLGNNE